MIVLFCIGYFFHTSACARARTNNTTAHNGTQLRILTQKNLFSLVEWQTTWKHACLLRCRDYILCSRAGEEQMREKKNITCSSNSDQSLFYPVWVIFHSLNEFIVFEWVPNTFNMVIWMRPTDEEINMCALCALLFLFIIYWICSARTGQMMLFSECCHTLAWLFVVF